MLETFFTIIIPIGLLIIMLGMGMSLNIDAFQRIIKMPVPVAVGLIAQLLLLPAFAFLLIKLFQLEGAMAMGLILLTACPGGVSSNAWTYALKADVALSVSLTALNSVVLPFTLPFVFWLGLQYLGDAAAGTTVDVPIKQLVTQLVIMSLLPIVVGMIVGRYFPKFADFCEPYIRRFTLILLLFIVAVMIVMEREFLLEHAMEIGLVLMTLMACAMLTGYLLAKAMSLPEAQCFTIILEVGIQNTTIAVFIATNILHDKALAVVPTTYGMLMIFPLIALSILRSRLIRTAKS